MVNFLANWPLQQVHGCSHDEPTEKCPSSLGSTSSKFESIVFVKSVSLFLVRNPVWLANQVLRGRRSRDSTVITTRPPTAPTCFLILPAISQCIDSSSEHSSTTNGFRSAVVYLYPSLANTNRPKALWKTKKIKRFIATSSSKAKPSTCFFFRSYMK